MRIYCRRPPHVAGATCGYRRGDRFTVIHAEPLYWIDFCVTANAVLAYVDVSCVSVGYAGLPTAFLCHRYRGFSYVVVLCVFPWAAQAYPRLFCVTANVVWGVAMRL